MELKKTLTPYDVRILQPATVTSPTTLVHTINDHMALCAKEASYFAIADAIDKKLLTPETASLCEVRVRPFRHVGD